MGRSSPVPETSARTPSGASRIGCSWTFVLADGGVVGGIVVGVVVDSVVGGVGWCRCW